MEEIAGRLDRIEARLAAPTPLGQRTVARLTDLEAVLERLLSGQVDPSTLAGMDLTPAESRVAMALFKGQSVEQYAKESRIGISTVRWHIKQIHLKTGVKSQQQLFHLLLRCNGTGRDKQEITNGSFNSRSTEKDS